MLTLSIHMFDDRALDWYDWNFFFRELRDEYGPEFAIEWRLMSEGERLAASDLHAGVRLIVDMVVVYGRLAGEEAVRRDDIARWLRAGAKSDRSP